MLYLTLIPYPSFRQSVACYSDDVLKQTLHLVFDNYPFICGGKQLNWHREVCWSLWKPWKQAYIRFGLMCIEEMELRNLSYPCDMVAHFTCEKRGKHWDKPLWIGWNRLHSNHRAALLQAGEIECIRRRIVGLLKLENVSSARRKIAVDNWFEEWGYNCLFEGDESYNNEIHQCLDTLRAPGRNIVAPNHYAQFNWTEEPCGDLNVYPPHPNMSWMTDER